MGGVKIPDDIEAAALAAWTSVPTADWEANAVDIIARAILAERQRCVDPLRENHTITNGEPLDPAVPDILAAMEK
ncbi:hypothetical protein [Sinorhizobium meliloti]|uniref:hypothetical protein n=1 Tax=Rhizobium meliloti TaxID=382 RepID=UPI000FD7067D|nr:hypothetical protein [Sinorhizobium meliloti]RVN11284.1 hypothetical protein CN112_10340 [Sinorhizobium meliloti]